MASEMLSPLCCSWSYTCCFPTLSPNVSRLKPEMSYFGKQDCLQHKSKLRGYFWCPARHHSTSHFHSVVHGTVLRDVQRLSFCQHTQNVVQVRAVPLILNDQRSLPSCSPECTLGFVKSFVSTKLILDCTSACADAARCVVNSCVTASSCAVCNAIISLSC